MSCSVVQLQMRWEGTRGFKMRKDSVIVGVEGDVRSICVQLVTFVWNLRESGAGSG